MPLPSFDGQPGGEPCIQAAGKRAYSFESTALDCVINSMMCSKVVSLR